MAADILDICDVYSFTCQRGRVTARLDGMWNPNDGPLRDEWVNVFIKNENNGIWLNSGIFYNPDRWGQAERFMLETVVKEFGEIFKTDYHREFER